MVYHLSSPKTIDIYQKYFKKQLMIINYNGTMKTEDPHETDLTDIVN